MTDATDNPHLTHLINRPTAAKMLGVSVETIGKIVEAGALDEVRLHPTAWPRLRRADVEALARGEQPTKKGVAS